MFGGLGTTELVLILVLVFVIFGVGKLPQVAKMLGSGVNSFKKGLSGEADDEEAEAEAEDTPELLEEDKSLESGADEHERQAQKAHAEHS